MIYVNFEPHHHRGVLFNTINANSWDSPPYMAGLSYHAPPYECPGGRNQQLKLNSRTAPSSYFTPELSSSRNKAAFLPFTQLTVRNQMLLEIDPEQRNHQVL